MHFRQFTSPHRTGVAQKFHRHRKWGSRKSATPPKYLTSNSSKSVQTTYAENSHDERARSLLQLCKFKKKLNLVKNLKVEKTDFGFGGTPPPNLKFETPETWRPCRDPRVTPRGEKIWGKYLPFLRKLGSKKFSQPLNQKWGPGTDDMGR